MAGRRGSTPSYTTSFNVFFDGWLARQRALLDELVHISIDESDNVSDNSRSSSKDDQLIEKVLSHYGEYYHEKAKLMSEDIFLVFCPPWLSSFEKALLWAAGFKPSLLFSLLDVISASNMVSEQVDRLKILKAETASEEKELTDALAMAQEKVGSPPLMQLAREVERLVDGQVSDFDEAMQELKEAIAGVVERADDLRRSTAMKAVEILNRDQRVKFLIALAKYQLGVRAWGLQKDNQRDLNFSSEALI